MCCLYVVDEEDVYDTDNILIQMPKKGALRTINPLPHGVIATFSPTAGGLMGPPKKESTLAERRRF
jgi:hypothetical protein